MRLLVVGDHAELGGHRARRDELRREQGPNEQYYQRALTDVVRSLLADADERLTMVSGRHWDPYRNVD